MYVCICNGYRERDLIALAESGVRTAEAAYSCLGSEPQCSRCLNVAQGVLDRHCTDEAAPEPLPAGRPASQLAL